MGRRVLVHNKQKLERQLESNTSFLLQKKGIESGSVGGTRT